MGVGVEGYRRSGYRDTETRAAAAPLHPPVFRHIKRFTPGANLIHVIVTHTCWDLSLRVPSNSQRLHCHNDGKIKFQRAVHKAWHLSVFRSFIFSPAQKHPGHSRKPSRPLRKVAMGHLTCPRAGFSCLFPASRLFCVKNASRLEPLCFMSYMYGLSQTQHHQVV